MSESTNTPSSESEKSHANRLRMAAEQGDAPAQRSLGILYEEGNGIPQNVVEAAKWFQLAAEQGDAEAQFRLGRYHLGQATACEEALCSAPELKGYINEESVFDGKKEAVKWLHLAANQGHVRAQLSLGNCYFHGEGIHVDEFQDSFMTK